jgi:hypothetical protein
MIVCLQNKGVVPMGTDYRTPRGHRAGGSRTAREEVGKGTRRIGQRGTRVRHPGGARQGTYALGRKLTGVRPDKTHGSRGENPTDPHRRSEGQGRHHPGETLA